MTVELVHKRLADFRFKPANHITLRALFFALLALTQTPLICSAEDYGSSTSSTTNVFGVSGPKTWELRTAPIAYLAKWYSVDIAYVFGEQFAIGPSAIFYSGDKTGNMLSPSYKGVAYGFSAAYYFKPLDKNGTYISTHAYIDEFENYPHGAPSGDYDKFKGYKANLVYGYRTHFSVFSVSMGLGAEYRDYDVSAGKNTYTSDSDREYGRRSGFIPYAEFKIGIEI